MLHVSVSGLVSHMVMVLAALVQQLSIRGEYFFWIIEKYTPLLVYCQHSVLLFGTNISQTLKGFKSGLNEQPQIEETVGHCQHLSVLSLCNLADLSSQTS